MPLWVYYRTFAAIVAGITLTSEAQTNIHPASIELPMLFESPHLHIEPINPVLSEIHLQETNSGLPSIKPPSVEDKMIEHKIQPSESVAAITVRGDTAFDLENHGLGLVQPPEPQPHDLLSRGSEAIFKPEVFHIGKNATISCSILTAIKRRDPLCLINPHFLKITW